MFSIELIFKALTLTLLFSVWNHERPGHFVELTLRLEYLDQYDYINLITHLTVNSGVLNQYCYYFISRFKYCPLPMCTP